MDDEFKGILRFLSIVLLLTLIWAGLTKAGLIPNWFEIEALCPNSKISLNVDSDDDRDTYQTMVPDVYLPDVDMKNERDNQFREDGTHKIYTDYEDDPELSVVMKNMGLRATGCYNIFCQQIADDGTTKNLKHYYWDKVNKKMILLSNIYYVSGNDCAYYDGLYGDKTDSQLEEDENHIKNDLIERLYKGMDGNGKNRDVIQ